MKIKTWVIEKLRSIITNHDRRELEKRKKQEEFIKLRASEEMDSFIQSKGINYLDELVKSDLSWLVPLGHESYGIYKDRKHSDPLTLDKFEDRNKSEAK